MNTTVTAKTVVLQDELKYDGVTLLTYKIQYPEFHSASYRMCLQVVNKFYQMKAEEYQKRCQGELFNMAVEQYKIDKENGYPLHVFEVLQVYTLTYSEECIISLYFDRYEYTGGAHGNTVRDSQTWNLQKCGRIRLGELYHCPGDYKTYILKIVNAEIAKNPEDYFEDYKKLTADTFNERNYYCTPKGIVFYYQQYDIAPYSSGIREFLIPYRGCLMDPKMMCFRVM